MNSSDMYIAPSILGIIGIFGLLYYYSGTSKHEDDVIGFVDKMFIEASRPDDFDLDILREARHTSTYYGGRRTRRSKSGNKKTKRM